MSVSLPGFGRGRVESVRPETVTVSSDEAFVAGGLGGVWSCWSQWVNMTSSAAARWRHRVRCCSSIVSSDGHRADHEPADGRGSGTRADKQLTDPLLSVCMS